MQDSLIKDGNGISIQIGNSFVCSDASASPVTSPFTLSGGVDVFVPPLGAVEMILNPLTTDINVSNLSAGTPYDVIALDTKESIPCARMKAIYIQGTSGNVLNFRFTII